MHTSHTLRSASTLRAASTLLVGRRRTRDANAYAKRRTPSRPTMPRLRRWDDRPGVERFATPSDLALRSVTPHDPHR